MLSAGLQVCLTAAQVSQKCCYRLYFALCAFAAAGLETCSVGLGAQFAQMVPGRVGPQCGAVVTVFHGGDACVYGLFGADKIGVPIRQDRGVHEKVAQPFAGFAGGQLIEYLVRQCTIRVTQSCGEAAISCLAHPSQHGRGVTFEQCVNHLVCCRREVAVAAEEVVQDGGAGTSWAQPAVMGAAMHTTVPAVAEEGWFAFEARRAQRTQLGETRRDGEDFVAAGTGFAISGAAIAYRGAGIGAHMDLA